MAKKKDIKTEAGDVDEDNDLDTLDRDEELSGNADVKEALLEIYGDIEKASVS